MGKVRGKLRSDLNMLRGVQLLELKLMFFFGNFEDVRMGLKCVRR